MPPVAPLLLLWRSVSILLILLLFLGYVLTLLDTAHPPHGTNVGPLGLTLSPLNPWSFLGPYLMALSDHVTMLLSHSHPWGLPCDQPLCNQEHIPLVW